jgi:hypothetical protein
LAAACPFAAAAPKERPEIMLKTTAVLGVAGLATLGATAQAQLIGASFRAPDFQGPSTLYTIDTGTGQTSGGIITNVRALTGLTYFNGTLWGLTDQFGRVNGQGVDTALLTFDAVTGQATVIGNTDEVGGFQPTEGDMDFDPATGLLYIADGDLGGTNNLNTFDFGVGSLSLVGPTGLDGTPTGFGGLSALTFVPSPGTGVLFLVCALAAGRRRR